MKKIVCNYSVIRFLPYTETGEFVNVGILACCPQVGWMDFALEPRKTKRISDFFPELDINMFITGLKHILSELHRLVAEHRLVNPAQWALPTHQKYMAGLFNEIVRPREELFYFGEPATLLTEDPVRDIQALFKHYVERYFAKHRDYQEKIMTDRLTTLFRAKNLLTRYHREQVGNADYHVMLPFVERQGDDPRPLRALKPLNLDQAEPTQIREHGDQWCAKICRLQKMECIPHQMLFAVKCPATEEKKRFDAADEICELLKQHDMLVKDFNEQEALIQFAEQAG